MRRFLQQKDKAINGLKASISVGDVDEELIPLLGVINSLEDYYTTSSCAGRISLLCDLGGKGANKFLGKWHRKVDAGQVLSALKGNKRTVWFMYEPPILHVVAKTLEKADEFIKAAREAGFKRSGIQSIKDGRVLIEILSTERIDAPVASVKGMLIDEEDLNFLSKASNKKLMQSRQKISRLKNRLLALGR